MEKNPHNPEGPENGLFLFLLALDVLMYSFDFITYQWLF
ncbi:hypothetical protein A0J51_03276 [Gluconobacter japonicus]|nr:hypothetical protein A0J51_03276 [Gluconobacter japonicus]